MRVHMAMAVGARSRSALPRGSRMAPGRAEGLEENGAGPSGDGIYRTHTQRAVRERGRRICPPGNDRSKIHA